MFTPERKKTDVVFEKVKVNDLLPTVIEAVQYETERNFKGFEGAPDQKLPAIRFKFQIEGCQFPHYSRWMKFNAGEKSNLYGKYLSALVDGIKPDAKYDLDNLIGMKVKTLWVNNGEFQNLQVIVPAGEKLKYTDAPAEVVPF